MRTVANAQPGGTPTLRLPLTQSDEVLVACHSNLAILSGNQLAFPVGEAPQLVSRQSNVGVVSIPGPNRATVFVVSAAATRARQGGAMTSCCGGRPSQFRANASSAVACRPITECRSVPWGHLRPIPLIPRSCALRKPGHPLAIESLLERRSAKACLLGLRARLGRPRVGCGSALCPCWTRDHRRITTRDRPSLQNPRSGLRQYGPDSGGMHGMPKMSCARLPNLSGDAKPTTKLGNAPVLIAASRRRMRPRRTHR